MRMRCFFIQCGKWCGGDSIGGNQSLGLGRLLAKPQALVTPNSAIPNTVFQIHVGGYESDQVSLVDHGILPRLTLWVRTGTFATPIRSTLTGYSNLTRGSPGNYHRVTGHCFLPGQQGFLTRQISSPVKTPRQNLTIEVVFAKSRRCSVFIGQISSPTKSRAQQRPQT